MDKPQSGADIPASGARADIAPPPSATTAPQPQGQLSPDGRWWWNGTQWVPAPAGAAAAAAVPGTCQVCGGTPATQVTLRSVVALVIFGITRTQRGVFCRDCGLAIFRQRMSQTLMTGWWGIFHFFINIFVVIGNLRARAQLVRLAAPTRGPNAQFLDPGRPVFLRPGFAVFVGALLIVSGYLIEQHNAAVAPFPDVDNALIGTCVQQSGHDWSPVDCSSTHNGKVVALSHSADGCASQYTPAKLDDGNYTCIDTTQ